jgi:hypothetical protein
MTASNVRKLMTRLGKLLVSSFRFTPTCCGTPRGYKLANDGHDMRSIQQYMGHKDIMHTVRYTELAPDRFTKCFRD